MTQAAPGRIERIGMQVRRWQLGSGVVWLTALIVIPILIAELQSQRPPAAAMAAVARDEAPAIATYIDNSGLVASPIAAPIVAVALPAAPAMRPAARPAPAPRERRADDLAYVNGPIRGGDLYAAGFAAGLPLPVLAAVVRAFAYDVDFQREVGRGDSFEVAFERSADGSADFAARGLRYAALTLAGKRRALYRFNDDWYDETGAGARKPLLRTPVDGAQLTSRFGSRFHPLLGYTTAHRGVDFGAQAGSPVQAAGDGVVEMAERNGRYGNYMRIRHDGGLATAYAHLARFAPGVGPGTRVRQGQVIAFVGATGMATAPHLHYEVLRGGTQVDPLGVRFAATRLSGAQLAAFKATVMGLDRRVAEAATARSGSRSG